MWPTSGKRPARPTRLFSSLPSASCSLLLALLFQQPLLNSLFSSSSLFVNAYTWPTPVYDQIEELYILESGFGSKSFGGVISSCSANPPGTASSRKAFAEWIRVAFHDFATADAAAGLGGLDGSIAFETNSPENNGPAFNSTLGFYARFQNEYVSMADLIALGTVKATGRCGGPIVPLRVGRQDATQAGRFGVPIPEQSLDTMKLIFAEAGMSPTEMIGLVACGHTVGGVHGADFPTIAPNSITSSNPTGETAFDNSIAAFDNHVAKEWIDIKTCVNPMAVGPDSLRNSDGRIFASDGNKTMAAFAKSNSHFLSTCSTLFAKMINTVPSTSKLSDKPIVAVREKPFQPQLSLDPTDGTLRLDGFFRIHDWKHGRSTSDYSNVRIDLFGSTNGQQKTQSFNLQPVSNPTKTNFGSVTFWQYAVRKIDPTAGFSGFTASYTVDSTAHTADNGGKRFALTDVIMLQPDQSCVSADGKTVNVVAAVRTHMFGVAYVRWSTGNVQANSASKQIVSGRTVLKKLDGQKSSNPDMYDLYGASFAQEKSAGSSFDLVVEGFEVPKFGPQSQKPVAARCAARGLTGQNIRKRKIEEKRERLESGKRQFNIPDGFDGVQNSSPFQHIDYFKEPSLLPKCGSSKRTIDQVDGAAADSLLEDRFIEYVVPDGGEAFERTELADRSAELRAQADDDEEADADVDSGRSSHKRKKRFAADVLI